MSQRQDHPPLFGNGCAVPLLPQISLGGTKSPFNPAGGSSCNGIAFEDRLGRRASTGYFFRVLLRCWVRAKASRQAPTEVRVEFAFISCCAMGKSSRVWEVNMAASTLKQCASLLS